MKDKVLINESNIEEMCILAEDVMQALYMNYADYDSEGNDILWKCYQQGKDWETEILPLFRAEHRGLVDTVESRLLYNLFRRGDEIGEVRYYTRKEIQPIVEPLIDKALHIFRKGTDVSGDCNYIADQSVSDDFLIVLFIREVRNMMMIFAGQRMNNEDVEEDI